MESSFVYYLCGLCGGTIQGARMKTPTPQQRAEAYSWNAGPVGLEDAYLAGDKDREAIENEKSIQCITDLARANESIQCMQKEREAAGKGFDEYVENLEASGDCLDDSYDGHRITFQAARADRQELVDCVLEMYSILLNAPTAEKLEDQFIALADQHADLINRLKSEGAK